MRDFGLQLPTHSLFITEQAVRDVMCDTYWQGRHAADLAPAKMPLLGHAFALGIMQMTMKLAVERARYYREQGLV